MRPGLILSDGLLHCRLGYIHTARRILVQAPGVYALSFTRKLYEFVAKVMVLDDTDTILTILPRLPRGFILSASPAKRLKCLKPQA